MLKTAAYSWMWIQRRLCPILETKGRNSVQNHPSFKNVHKIERHFNISSKGRRRHLQRFFDQPHDGRENFSYRLWGYGRNTISSRESRRIFCLGSRSKPKHVSRLSSPNYPSLLYGKGALHRPPSY